MTFRALFHHRRCDGIGWIQVISLRGLRPCLEDLGLGAGALSLDSASAARLPASHRIRNNGPVEDIQRNLGTCSGY